MIFETPDHRWRIEVKPGIQGEDFAYLYNDQNLVKCFRRLAISSVMIAVEVYTVIYYQDCATGHNYTAEIYQAVVDLRNRLVSLFAYGRTRNLLA